MRRGAGERVNASAPQRIRDLIVVYASVPAEFRLTGPLDLPAALLDEVSIRRHVEGLLAPNTHTGEVLSFLGGGVYGGYVPAVVDEITRRAEFVTAYGGGPYGDPGKYQAIFEFQSLIGELVGMEAVSAPTYDGITATTSALLVATRLTGRRRLLVPESANPQREHLATFAKPWATIDPLPRDVTALAKELGRAEAPVAAVLLEMPSYLGFVEERASEIAASAHAGGALVVVSVDPSSLGVLAPPADYGADLVTGDAQSLGNHQLFGGGQCGFIAHRDEEAYVRESPAIKVSAVPCARRHADRVRMGPPRGDVYDLRGESRDFTGTSQWLWGIGAAVYLSLLGPTGLLESERARRTHRLRHATAAHDPGCRDPVRRSSARARVRRRSLALGTDRG